MSSGEAFRDEQSVPIADIVVRDDWQVRDKVQLQTVNQYATVMRNGVEMPPVTLARVNGALVLVDGWHRLAAAKNIGEDHIRATVEDMSEGDASWAAATANSAHGLPLKRREKFKVFQRYMEERRYLVSKRGELVKSLSEIAMDLGGIYSRSGINNLIKANYPKVAARMSRGSGESRQALDPPTEGGPTTAFERLAWDHMRQLLAVARGLSGTKREEAARTLEQMAEAVRTASAWEPKPPKPFDL